MAYPNPAQSVGELMRALEGSAHVEDGRLVIDDEHAFRADGVRQAVWSATFSPEPCVIEAARWVIWEASQALGALSASIHDLYMARGRGEVHGFTVPAVNLRTQVFDMAATMCRASQEIDSGAMIFELARSEQEYTFQRPGEYITSVLAGCIAAGWQGPVFVQGDHYQFNAKKYAEDPEATTDAIRKATRDAIGVGYGNIDIDSSTLVDLSKPTVNEQQRVNYERAAEISALIRDVEPDDMTVSIGGEIGEVGKKNSTEEELRAYLDGYRDELGATGRPRHCRPVQGERPDGHQPRWRPAAGRRRGRGEARLRHPRTTIGGCARIRAGGGGPARRLDPARRAVPSLPRRSRRPRSTSPPASRTSCTSTPPSQASCCATSRPGATRTSPRRASRTRPRNSSCTRRARRRLGRSSGSSGSCPPRTRSSPRSTRRCASCSRSSEFPVRARWSSATSDRRAVPGRRPRRSPRWPRRGPSRSSGGIVSGRYTGPETN